LFKRNGLIVISVVDAMLKTGFTADEIDKVGGGNFCRVFDAATTGHH
jgi:membrane dipeptidase